MGLKSSLLFLRIPEKHAGLIHDHTTVPGHRLPSPRAHSWAGEVTSGSLRIIVPPGNGAARGGGNRRLGEIR